VPGDRGGNDLVVAREPQPSGRTQVGEALDFQPGAPVHPWVPSVGVVVFEQHVVAKVGGHAQRPAHVAREPRAAHRKDALAEEANRVRSRERRRSVADREVQPVALQVEHPRLGADAHVHLGVRAREAREPRDQPQRGEGLRGGHRERAAARERA
jgi:hypothetical protein